MMRIRPRVSLWLDRVQTFVLWATAVPLFYLRLGRPEPVEQTSWQLGQYTIRTIHGTVLRVTSDRARTPRPTLRRWPGPGSGPSGFDYPGPPRMIRYADVQVGRPARFEDTSGSYFYGPETWTTSVVDSIQLRRTHCARCAKPVLRGWCWRRHPTPPAD